MKNETIPYPAFAILITALYMAQGLPGGLIAHALPAFLREQGVSLALISSLKLLALPWLLKFIWAPLVDSTGSNTQRFRWILVMQSLMIAGLLALSLTITSVSFAAISAAVSVLLLINLASATQDIACDGLTAAQTPRKYLGLANSIQVAAYKVGMLIGGSGLLLLTPYFEVPELIRLLSTVVGLLLLLVLYLKRQYFSFTCELPNNHNQSPTPRSISFIFSSYRDFFTQQGIKAWLLVLLTYKVADSLGSSMFKPMLVDKGVLLSDIGLLTIYSTAAGLLGAILAGALYRLLGMKFSLLAFGLLQTISVTSFYTINAYSLSINEIYLLAISEQFCDGLSTVALFAVMMRSCRKGHEGADYTIQASLQIALAGVVGALSGVFASAAGYDFLYMLCALFGGLSFVLTWNYVRQVKVESA